MKMQFTIKNTSIFDKKVQNEFRKYIQSNIKRFKNDRCYSLVIRYNAKSLLNSSNLSFENSLYDEVEIKFKYEDREHKALGIQLTLVNQILKENKIECYSCTIEGDDIKNNNIQIIIKEDKSEPSYNGRGKNKKRITVSCIMADKAYIMKILGKSYNERMSEIYFKITNNIGNEVMCRILDIENTNDENEIYKVFCKEYGDLWLCTEKRTTELKEKLINRVKRLAKLENNRINI